MIRIEGLLRKEIGLDAASIGSSQIQRTVRLRMKGLGLKKPEEYYQLLEKSPAEMSELIEEVVVTETWFFRDKEPFVAFTQLAMQWLNQNPAGTLRVLSVPCSSGEEPYSLAMALLDLNVAMHRLSIHAVDISAHALARARNAVYGKNSFRSKDLSFRDRHFRHSKEGFVLSPPVRECVQFHRDNLLGDDFLKGHAPYDFIFCRNLLIYFDRATQARAFEKLQSLLTSSGVLFVGPAEMPLVTYHGFVNANVPMAFACRKLDPRNGRARETLVRSNASARLANTRSSAAPSSFGSGLAQEPGQTELRRVLPVHAETETPCDLDAAQQLADRGELHEAAVICEECLRKEGPSAQAYYLLGLVRDAAGDELAVEFYRKALYLEPNHYETLLQMSLLLEKKGDTAGARTFKRRAEKAQPKN
jgi:chemotaxis protein methyltransferase WspC